MDGRDALAVANDAIYKNEMQKNNNNDDGRVEPKKKLVNSLEKRPLLLTTAATTTMANGRNVIQSLLLEIDIRILLLVLPLFIAAYRSHSHSVSHMQSQNGHYSRLLARCARVCVRISVRCIRCRVSAINSVEEEKITFYSCCFDFVSFNGSFFCEFFVDSFFSFSIRVHLRAQT